MEYPSSVQICNISNETLVCRVYLENAETVEIPIPIGFTFRGNDQENYKMDVSNFLMELISEGDLFNLGHLYLGLPTPDEVLTDLDKFIREG